MSHVKVEIASQPDCWLQAAKLAGSPGLPAAGERVLAARDGLFVGEAYLSESGVWRRYYGALWVLLGCAPVTHWMPLPDAPEVTCDG